LLWSAHTDGSAWFAAAKDITERKRLEARAFEDPLTHLPNRAVVVDRLKHARARQARSGSQLAVMFLDLDGFGAANEAFGAGVGDQLLVGAAKRLGRLVRDSDTIARLGGDEFAVIAEGIGSAENAAMVAGRVVDGFRQPLVPQESIVLGASVGVALADPGRTCTAEELLREADTAMCRAKSAGGSQFALHHVAALGDPVGL
jgi:diguanylate cyclase (GGDEF)-like protein